MRDRQQLEDLTGAVSLGLLAEQMVAATGQVLRDQPVSDQQRASLTVARDLLKALSETPTNVVLPASESHHYQMASDEAFLDTFRAIKLQAPSEPTQTYLEKLSLALDHFLSGQIPLTDDDRKSMACVQDLFLRLGQLTLNRAHDFFDRPREESNTWTRLNTTSDF